MILTHLSRPAARLLAGTVLVWLLHVALATPALALQKSPTAAQPDPREAPGDGTVAGKRYWNAKLRELRAERREQRRAERRAKRLARRAARAEARAERRAQLRAERRTARLVKRAERLGGAGIDWHADEPAAPGDEPAPAEEPTTTPDEPADPADQTADPADVVDPAEPADPVDEDPAAPAPAPVAGAPADPGDAPAQPRIDTKPDRPRASTAPAADPVAAPVTVEPAPGQPVPYFPLPVRPVPYTGEAGTVRAILMAAQQQIGWPYVWGGESRTEGGFDCSGLIDYAYSTAGIELPGRPTAAVLWQLSQPITRDELQPGDLVFVGAASGAPHHVAMYVGDGTVVVARYTGTLITLQPLDAVGWDGFGRLLAGPRAGALEPTPASDADDGPDSPEPKRAPQDPTPTRPDEIRWLDRIARYCPMPEPEGEHEGEGDAASTLVDLVDPDGNGLPGGVA